MKFKQKIILLLALTTAMMTGCSFRTAKSAYQDALAAQSEKDYKNAEVYYKEAIHKNADKAEYYIDYGFNQIAQKEYQDARKQFNRVIMDKDIPMVHENNKKAYRGVGISYLMEGNYKLAEEQFEKALMIHENNSLNLDLMMYQALCYRQLGEYDKAIENYTEILKQDSDYVTAYENRAEVYQVLKKFKESIEDYDEAIHRSPDSVRLYINKAVLLKEQGKEKESLIELSKADSLLKDVVEPSYEKAYILYLKNDFDQAQVKLMECMKAGDSRACYLLGEISFQLKQYDKALLYYKDYITEGNITTALLYHKMASLSLLLKDTKNAKLYMDKAADFQDTALEDELLKNEIIYLELTNDYQAALIKLEEYSKKYPEDEKAKRDAYYLKTRIADTKETSKEDKKETDPVVLKP